MARVLLIGESWFTYSVHQKGFDSFYTSEYIEGGGAFIRALESVGHSVDYIPSHLIDSKMPETASSLAMYDVIAISDVGANSFQLPSAAFTKSVLSADKSSAIRDFVASGGSVLMIGGYLSFSGIDAKARWGRSLLADVLPVKIMDIDDRVERPAGVSAKVTVKHPVTVGLDPIWPPLLGFNEVLAREGAEVLADIDGHPLLVIGTFGKGRAAAFTSDIAPHWAPEGFTNWAGYPMLWDQLVTWLAGEQ